MSIKIEKSLDNVPYIQLGSHQLRLDLEDLTPEEKQRAEQELRETPENVKYALEKLKELLGDEPDFFVPIDDDIFLTKFLRPCRFIPENAFRIMRKYYGFKIKYPKFSCNITPAGIRHVFDKEIFKMLPTRTSNGCRIMIVSLEKWDPKQVKLEDLFKAVMVAMEIAMLEPKTQCGGVEIILDTKGLALIHIYQITPTLAKIILEWIQECCAVRLKGIHVINQPLIFNMGYKIFKPFLGERLKKALFFHGHNAENLLKRISPESLPPKYGGTADIPEYPGSLFSDMLFYYEKNFEEYNTYGYKEDTKTVQTFNDTKEEISVTCH
ncbi:alpha-tocopherol transfer protein-like [Diorhabda sublineata]|uniref:alpha-tocopherol transfer protein-like n=1 Tax=Diorhabda sublineata TaxID=1163346 RepID=UPI0024E12D30|nr:alpha-tocopherol transfer protein-like [Diorhabda sublineata]XP_056648771.1 alpha-tocopherol transfer protein-like [Diorhabda sublineata]XP_056648772.1 alpha-tocopherol transfer protein-like [Diorhabda sublineata]XP_056648774.1 alpha-tocopherol transfer protein-like [Diorhabda sublineata]